MAAKVGSLLIDIHANVSQLSKDFAKAQGALDGALGKMSGALKAFGAAAGAYFATDKIVGFVTSAIDGADALSKMSAKTGASVEALSALQHAANLSDASIEEVGGALAKLSQRAVDAANGSSKAQRAFAQLGIEFRNGDGSIRASDELLLDLADRMKALPDGAAKSGLAMKLLGDAGVKLIPMLNGGREGLEAMKREAEDLGLVLDGETAKRAEAFNDNLTRIQTIGTGLANVIADRLLPTLVQFTDWLVENGKHAREFGEYASTAFKLVASAGLFLWRVVEDVGRGLGAVGATVVELFRGNFAEAGRISEMAAADSQAAWSKTFDDIGKLWAESPEAPKAAVEETKRAVQTIPPALRKVGDEAEKVAERIAASLHRTASLAASLTRTRTDDIRESYAAQIEALESKVAREKTTEEERAAYVAEIRALGAKRDQELAQAQVDEHRAAERRKIDAEQEAASARAQLTEDQADDIEAKYAEQLEALRRRHEEELLTDEEFANRRAILLAQKEQEITAAAIAETQRRTAEQRALMESVTRSFVQFAVDGVFTPLGQGFKNARDALKQLGNMIAQVAKQLVMTGIMKLIIAGAAGAVSGGAGAGLAMALADGGYVRGPGGPRDDKIPAMLSDREFVVNAAATERVGVPFLNWINSLGDRPATRLPRYADGGLVSYAPGRAGTGAAGAAGAVTLSPTFVVQAGGGLLHRELLVRELGPAIRQMAIEQMDGMIRQLGLNPAAVSARG